VTEDITGASYARNCGWKNALGSVVFYIDDDAYPSSTIIDDIHKLADQDSIISFTGRTIYWRGNDPLWIKPSYVEMPNLSDKMFPMYEKGHLNGCACGFRKSALKQVGGFRLDLDMKGKKLGYGVEEDMRLKLLQANIPTYYVPYIKVKHKAHNKTVAQYLNSAYHKGKYFAKVQSKSRLKTLGMFMITGTKSIPIFVYKWTKMPYQNACIEAFSLPLNYLGQLVN
jgi:GT2 family glycosyltransferase